MKYLIWILLFTQISYADPAVFLDKDKPAPFSGYLLSPEKVKELYNKDIDLNFYKKANDNLNLQIVDYEKRVTNYQTQNDKLSERLSKSETGFFERAGFFILGSLITGFVAYGVYRSK